MPRNSSGNYTLPAGNPVSPNTLIETTWANPTLSDVASALTDSLDRLGRGTMLAPLKLFDGTPVAPALSFNSEASLGLFRPAPGALGVAVGGAEVARFTTAGLTLLAGLVVAGATTFSPGPVGIGPASGLTTLTAPLMISANAAPFTGATPAGTVVHAVGADASPSRAVLDGVGNLAVFHGRRANGTLAAPAAVPADASLAAFAGGGFNGAAWTTNLDGGMFVRAAELWTGTANGTYLMFATQPNGTAGAAVERMRVTDTGAVHPGTNGGQNLGTAGFRWATVYATAFSDGADLLVDSSGTLARFAAGAGWTSAAMFTGGVERMRIDAAGNVGIGLAPGGSAKLDVLADATNRFRLTGNTGQLFFDSLDATATLFAPMVTRALTHEWRNTGGTMAMILTGTNLGIGVTPGPAYRLDVGGGGTVNAAVRSTSSTGYTAARLFNDAARSLEMVYVGSAYPGSVLSGSPAGEAASLATAQFIPLSIGTNNTARINISAAGIVDFTSGSGSLRIGGHVTRFEAVVAMPAVTGPGSLTTIAHGGGRVPDYYTFTYRCAVAEHGYTPGQEVFLQTVAGNMTVMFKADGTNCYFMAPIAMGVVYVGTGANTLVTLTPANWRLVLHALWL